MLSTEVDQEIFNILTKFCQENGLKKGFIIEKALREYLKKEEK
jgi:hypothetical protein